MNSAKKTFPQIGRQIVFPRTMEKFKLPILLLALHAPLGLAFYSSGTLGFLHQWGVFALGLYWALNKKEKLEKAAFAAAYIIGAEVLWRMSNVTTFWEFGKYAAALIMIAALVQRGLWQIPSLPMLYFLLLLPSCLLTFAGKSLSEGREIISFNLSGPFLLFVSCWFFSHLKISMTSLKKFIFALIIPIFSVLVTTMFYTVTTEEIFFGTGSNFATSGGFGPNQVSAILGLGAFAGIIFCLLLKSSVRQTAFAAGLILLFSAQSMLTFSRGGMYSAVGATAIALFFMMQNVKESIGRMLPLALIVIIFLLVVFPFLNDFTGGTIGERFENSDSTHRVEILESDLWIFAENPVFGIGVGEAYANRERFLGFKAVSHTEFTRMISEHGIFGVFSLAALILMIFSTLKTKKSALEKALASGFTAWSILFMMNAGMRLAAPSVLWGAAFLTLVSVPEKRENSARSRQSAIRQP